MIRTLLLFVTAVVAGTFGMEILQNIGTNVWLARGLGAAISAAVGMLGYFMFLRGNK